MFKRTIAALAILAAMLCPAVKVDAASKPTQWLIYWYVCGTDIETTRIAFGNGTDLMSDDPNALFLAEPDKRPGDATRCINEVEKAELSPDVKIFMQAGGAYIWGHKNFRDLNAKIQTKVEVIDTDGKGNPIIAKDENGNPIKDEQGNYKYKTIYGNIISSTKLRIPHWFLRKDGATVAKPIPGGNGKIGRYVYDKYHRNWIPREQLQISGVRGSETDMGSQAGLVSFLKAGQKLERELYPDGNVRRVFIFVDHGGGSITIPGLDGVLCADEYTGKALSLKEIQNAFAQVQNGWANPDEKPFEVVAIDACEMSTYETAVALEKAANYMVASQEPMYGKVMFGYTDLLNNLSANPAMSGAQLGKVFCDTYWDDSKVTDKEFGMRSNEVLTATVIDLSEGKMDALKTAYENFGVETRNFALKNSDEFAQNFIQFKKAAAGAEKYPSANYANPPLVDLKGLAKNVEQNITELAEVSGKLVFAIDNAVIYQKRGDTLNRGGGLSTHYPFNILNSTGTISGYQQLAKEGLAPKAQGELYASLYNEVTRNLTRVPDIDPKTKKPKIDPKTKKVIMTWAIPEDSAFDLSDLKEAVVDVDENDRIAWVELDKEQLKKIEGVRCQLIQVRAVDDQLRGVYLGSVGNVQEKLNEGKFVSSFSGKWVKIGGQTVLVHLASDSTKKNKHGKKIDGSELYVVPIYLNNQERNLFVSCKYPQETFTIIGVAPGSMSTIPSGELEGLQKGDVVVPRFIRFSVSEGDDMNINLVNGSPITIGYEPLKIEMDTLPDGNYAYMFEFVNPIGGKDVRADEFVIFKIRDGKVVDVKRSDKINELTDLS